MDAAATAARTGALPVPPPPRAPAARPPGAPATRIKVTRINWSASPHRERLRSYLADWFSRSGRALDDRTGLPIADYAAYAAKVGVSRTTLFKYVHADKDAAAVKAHNDYTAGKTQVRTTALMLGTEDMPELSIQVAYLWLAASEDVDLTFVLTAAGTLVHLAQQGYEAWSVHRRLPEELRIAEGRDKTFDKNDGTKDSMGVPTMATTDADVEEFAAEYHEVTRVVSLAQCKLITDAAVQSLAKYCVNLRSLDLFCCFKVTDVGLEAVAKGCPQITSLSLGWCSEVTDVGLEAVAKGCAQITSLDLRRCSKVTEEGKASLREALPGCEIED